MSQKPEKAAWFAVDWGTTHLRVWALDHVGKTLAALTSDQGMGDLAPDDFEPVLLSLIEPLLADASVTSVICCGMVGARQGWAEAPYVAVPCAPPDANAALRVDTKDPRLDVRILPGLSQARPADVMRGEETQIAGFLSHEPNFDGVLCLPGTHAKWAHISAGEVVSFQTYMTGELFALLSKRSVLRHGLQDEGWDNDCFAEAVSDGLSRPQALASAMFSLRADSLLHGFSSAKARARLSGLLIGLELAGSRPYWLGRDVVLLGDGALVSRYETALAIQGVQARRANAEALTLAGLSAAHAILKERRT